MGARLERAGRRASPHLRCGRGGRPCARRGGGPDPDLDFIWALEPGTVVDGQMDDETDEPLEGLFLYRRGPGGAVFGFGVEEAFDWDVMANLDDSSDLLLGEDLRFDVPTLALVDATIGDIVLAAQNTIAGSTPDVMFFGLAVEAGESGEWEEAEGFWRACLEAGEMKAHFGLGYTLVELGRPREGFGHLVMYTEITPRNSWAWHWRAQAAEAMGELEEARTSYRRAILAEEEGSYATDAAERLSRLSEMR